MRRDTRNRSAEAKRLADEVARSEASRQKEKHVRIEGLAAAAPPSLVQIHCLIDGYNLLHATDLIPAHGTKAVLAHSRELLLNFLTQLLSTTKASRTLVVFDGMHSPPGLPKSFHYRGLSVQFSERKESADDLLEKLLDDHPAPKQVTVISSDHRVQRAARSSGAKSIDSDAWIDEQRRLEINQKARSTSAASDKPPPPTSAGEVSAWIEFFEE